MTRVLTQQESAHVDTRSIEPHFPDWFSAQQDRYVSITKQMENYLALLPDDVKVRAIEALTKIVRDVFERETNRLRLAEEFYQSEFDASRRRHEVYEERLTELNDLLDIMLRGVTAVSTPIQELANVAENGELSDDIKSTQQETTHHFQHNEFHSRSLIGPITHWRLNHLDPLDEKQIKSWVKVIQAYLG